jgi:hypothetical protein
MNTFNRFFVISCEFSFAYPNTTTLFVVFFLYLFVAPLINGDDESYEAVISDIKRRDFAFGYVSTVIFGFHNFLSASRNTECVLLS